MLTKGGGKKSSLYDMPGSTAQSVLDSLPENLAVIDRKGVIVSVNKAWKKFPSSNGGNALDRGAVGENYQRLFKEAFKGKPGLKRSGADPASVLTGGRKKFSYEYTCLGPEGKVWYRLCISPIISEGKISGAVVSHTDITRRKLAEQESKRLAVLDPMTRILNKSAGLELLSNQINISSRQKRKLTVCYIDLDNLKYVNDNFGHREGDKALRKAVRLIRNALRDSDGICRLGGDELLVVLPNTSLEKCSMVIDRITDRIRRFNSKRNVKWKLGISYGLAELPAGGCSAEELVDTADRDMYRMKMGKKYEKGVN